MSMRILLIEDSMSLCEALYTVLQKEGYEVKIANDGESGLRHDEYIRPYYFGRYDAQKERV